MATKKFYAVKSGRKTGICLSWEECKASVEGFSGAKYKGFATKSEALEYLGLEEEADSRDLSGTVQDATEQTLYSEAGQGLHSEAESNLHSGIGQTLHHAVGQTLHNAVEQTLHSTVEQTTVRALHDEGKETLVAYVDGSYNDSLKKYAFGCVFILPDGKIYLDFGNGEDPKSLKHRNVTGEMLGAMYAAKTAVKNGYKAVEICYDYQGIEKWVTGEWKSKTELTQKYAKAMRQWANDIHIIFTKVPAHSNVRFNELADETAKRGLVEGQGIPKIRKLEEMERYGEGTDSTE